MPDKKTFTAEKIKTDEICGITGGTVSICGIDSASLGSISGSYISGENLIVSGNGNSLADFKSGVFDQITIGGVRYVPRQQIAYAFRFGGPPANVPTRLPGVTGVYAEGLNWTGISGVSSGTKLIYVDDGASFATGDHILIGGLTNSSEAQESHTITGITYYTPPNCCNSVAESDINAGQVGGTNRLYYHREREAVQIGDYITITGSQPYEVIGEYSAGGGAKYVDLSPNLSADVLSGDCICITPTTLHTQSGLSNDFVTGTQVANKYAKTITESGCTSGCYDSQYLYVDKAMYQDQTFDWNLTGYRESYIGFSGIEFNITGNNTSGLFTMQYPDI